MSGGPGSKPRVIQLQHCCARVKAALIQHNADLMILVGDTLPPPKKTQPNNNNKKTSLHFPRITRVSLFPQKYAFLLGVFDE